MERRIGLREHVRSGPDGRGADEARSCLGD